MFSFSTVNKTHWKRVYRGIIYVADKRVMIFARAESAAEYYTSYDVASESRTRLRRA